MTAESESFQAIADERDKMKEDRPGEREEAFKDMDEGRGSYKEGMNKLIYEDRKSYREMIDSRNEKQRELVEMIKDKADVNALKDCIEKAEAVLVKPKYIKRAKKFLVFMEYIKEFEGML